MSEKFSSGTKKLEEKNIKQNYVQRNQKFCPLNKTMNKRPLGHIPHLRGSFQQKKISLNKDIISHEMKSCHFEFPLKQDIQGNPEIYLMDNSYKERLNLQVLNYIPEICKSCLILLALKKSSRIKFQKISLIKLVNILHLSFKTSALQDFNNLNNFQS